MKKFTDFSLNEAKKKKKFVWPVEYLILSIGGYDGDIVKVSKLSITLEEAEEAMEEGETLEDAIKYFLDEELSGIEQGFGQCIAVPVEQTKNLIDCINNPKVG